jgi:peptidyl-prolyl cis-trans isomerase C
MLRQFHKSLFILFPVLVLAFSACSGKATTTVTAISPTEIPTQPATPTSLPVAIRINGEGIQISDYQEELKRLDSALNALGKKMTPEEMKTRVLDDLIGAELLNQESKKNGYAISESNLTTHIEQLIQTMGGAEAFKTWKQTMFFTDESFKRSLIRSLGSAWQRDEIIKVLPNTTEQVHARQILFIREESANNYRKRVDAGEDFANLAKEADPVTGGDLGWFSKGYLLQPEVEEAAFRLQPGEVSGVIKSAIGFHLVQVIEKDNARPIDPDAKAKIQRQAITDWVNKAKSTSQIEILAP